MLTATKFIKNISFNMIADFSVKVSKSLLFIFISNFLGISPMGAFSIALTFLGFGILFSNWGFGNLLTREISRDNAQLNRYLSNYGLLRIAFAALTVVLIHLIVPLFNYSAVTTSVIRIISISLIATTLIKLYHSLFIAFEELKYISIISLVGSILRLGTIVITMISGRGLIAVAVVYSVIEYVILVFSTILTFRFISDFHFDFNFDFAAQQIVKALPFFWIGILVMLDTRTEILILSWFFSERIVGYYTGVNTVLGGLTLLSEAIRNSIFPIITKLQISSPGRLKQVVYFLGKYILVFTIPISIIVFSQAEDILYLLFNNRAPLSILMLKITVWIFISYTLTVVTSSLLMAYNLENKVASALLISGTATVVFNFVLINIIGPEGVAIVRLGSSFVMLFICLFYLIPEAGFGIMNLKNSLFTLFAGGIMLGTLRFFENLNDYLSLLMGFILYVITLFLFQVIQYKDLTIWKKIIKSIVK